jgi:hypothetical protein
MEEPMSTTLTIPANMLADVREALFCLLGDATQAIDHALIHPDRDRHPERFAEHRKQLEHVLATLDLVGWASGEDRRDVEIDVRDHGSTLKEALDEYLPLLEDQEAEADANDRSRAEQGKPPRKEEIIKSLVACRDFTSLVERHLKELA